MVQSISPTQYETILRLPEVMRATGKPKSTLYRDIAEGTFPRGIKIGRRSGGWVSTWIARINAARIAGKSEEEIKQMVAEMNAERGVAAQFA